MKDEDIPLLIGVTFPEISMYCTDESQARLEKILLKLLSRLGRVQFCKAVASTICQIKNDQYADKLKSNTKTNIGSK